MDDGITAFERLRDSVLRSPGACAPGLRAAVEAHAAGRGADALPPVVAELVETIRLHAYKVRDEDVRALLDSGYSEDAVFEIVVAAAVGAGAMRFERAREELSDAAGEG